MRSEIYTKPLSRGLISFYEEHPMYVITGRLSIFRIEFVRLAAGTRENASLKNI